MLALEIIFKAEKREDDAQRLSIAAGGGF